MVPRSGAYNGDADAARRDAPETDIYGVPIDRLSDPHKRGDRTWVTA